MCLVTITFWQQNSKNMMGAPRSVLRQQSHHQRLAFPVPGDFGYDQPVGRKKLRPKHSAIHKLIFNHNIEQPQERAEDRDGQFKNYVELSQYDRQRNARIGEVIAKRKISPLSGLYSNPYEPEVYGKQKERGGNFALPHYSQNGGPSYLSKSELMEPPGRGLPSYHSKQYDDRSGKSLGRQLSGRSGVSMGLRGDSLDSLISPSNSVEKNLDAIIRMKHSNPTYIHTQL